MSDGERLLPARHRESDFKSGFCACFGQWKRGVERGAERLVFRQEGKGRAGRGECDAADQKRCKRKPDRSFQGSPLSRRGGSSVPQCTTCLSRKWPRHGANWGERGISEVRFKSGRRQAFADESRPHPEQTLVPHVPNRSQSVLRLSRSARRRAHLSINDGPLRGHRNG